LFTIKGLINQQFAEAAVGLSECLKEQPDNRAHPFPDHQYVHEGFAKREGVGDHRLF